MRKALLRALESLADVAPSSSAADSRRKPFGVVVKLLVVVIALTCVVQVCATVAMALGNYGKTKDQFEERLEAFLHARSELLGGLVWRLQYEELDRVLGGMLLEESVAAIVVYDETGAPVGRVERDLGGEAPRVVKRADLVHVNGVESDKAGEVEVVATMKDVYDAFELERRSALLLIGVSAGAIVSAVWLALSRLIARPLGQLRRAIARSQAGEPHVRLPERSPDEVGELFAAFNSFMEANDRSMAMIQAANEQLRRLAERDELTGLLNRRAAQTHFAEARGARGVSVIFMDIDLFKSANELLGHKGGDTLLREFVARLTAQIDGEAAAYRLGGDEILVIQRGVASSESALALGERLRQAVSGAYQIGFMAHEVTVSAGVYYAEQPLGDFDTVLTMSDLALREAKRLGRGRTTLLTEDLLDSVTQRIEIERSVAQALAEGQFEMFFQAQFDLQTKMVVGVEALARWRRPQRGMVSPGVFMPIIEDLGLSLEHGQLAIVQCCAAAERLMREFGRRIPVAMNVNAQQLGQAEFWTRLMRELERRGLPASAIVVEVTESQFIGNMELARRALMEYRASGGTVALDDFGTGYSSLAYLTQLPVDKVKIDRCFVKQAPDDESTATILGVAVQLAHAIGAEAIAEGVETEAEEAVVLRRGVRIVQGFRYGRPMELSALLADLRQSAEAPSEAAPLRRIS